MEEKNEPNVRVIAIKLPFDLQERILTFPFLHAISEYYPKADLHFITPEKEVEVLNLLPFRAYYHLFDEDEIKTVFDVHPYTANANIYNVDLFVSLTNSFPDACLGVGLRAKKRVGFSDEWKTLVLNRKMKRPVGHHVCEDFLKLFELATGEPVNQRLKVSSRALSRIIEDETPYLAINLAPLRSASIDDDWVELISKFEGQKILLFGSDDQVRLKPLLDTLLPTLPKRSTYEIFTYKDWIELARMLAHAQGLITYSGACGTLGAYVGCRVLALYENEDPQRTGPFYFLSDVVVMGINNPTLVNSSPQDKVLKDRVRFDLDEVFEKATGFFRL